jgi:hypothetical protein
MQGLPWLLKVMADAIREHPSINRECDPVWLSQKVRHALLVIVLWLSATPALPAATGAQENREFQRARMLATNICSVCHLFPEPGLLDRSTWTNQVKNRMRVTMDIAALEENPSPDARVLMAQWNAIWNDYIAVAAPEKPPPQDPRPPITPDLTLFTIEDPKYEVTNGYATMLQIDAGTRQIYVGNAIKRSLDVLDARGRLLASSPVDTTVTHLLKHSQGWVGTQIGIVVPNDLPLGRVTLFDRKENRFEPRCDLLTGLLRPVHTTIANWMGDTQEELIVSSFGNTLGRLAWYSRNGPCAYTEHSIVDRPGAVSSRVLDVDRDGKPELIALMAQAKEGVFLYRDKGGEALVEQALIAVPPVWGYAYFELADFNNDGHLDIVTANGDRGDFECPPRKYHGVRIYLNDGQWHFKESFFYPLNGAYKSMAADFDGDGDLDIVAISFFPDYEKSPEESFVYLENHGGMKFTAHTFPDCYRGRWLTMDAGDLDADGDLDVVLGGVYKTPFRATEALLRRWAMEGPSVLILRNTLAERRRIPTAK